MRPLPHLHTYLLILICSLNSIAYAQEKASPCTTCDDCYLTFAIKTNLLHDLILTPDIGAELNIGKHFSISVEGVWAWWSDKERHRFWRIAGGWGELRFWPGWPGYGRALSGHHIGVYGSIHKYDFEFGGKGWQSTDFNYGVGLSYGYSFPLSERINLDLSARFGYSSGPYVEYRYECGAYTAKSTSFRKYVGLTGLEVSFVWFPGNKKRNLPEFQL